MGRPYDKRRWRRLSAQILKESPRCERGRCPEPSSDVHHIDGLGPAGPRGYDRANLIALCKGHHSEITSQGLPRRTRPTERHPGLI
jgi:5-methylcytosine-specific restriction protein A